MRIKLDTTGIAAATELLAGFSERRLAAATATALSRAASAGKKAAQWEMRQAFDRVTPYAEKGLYARTATATRLEAEVGIADNPFITGTPAIKFLNPEVRGGARHVKRFELALQASGAMPRGWQSVPAAGAKLDAYGNVSRGQIAQILSQVGAELTAGHNRSIPRLRGGETDRLRRQVKAKRRRAFGRAGGQYVALPQGKGRLKPGIYLAEARDFGAKWGLGRTGKLVPVLLFVRGTNYSPRFDFFGTADAAMQAELGPQFARAVDEQAQRLADKLKGQP
jgi:hypothetical protein